MSRIGVVVFIASALTASSAFAQKVIIVRDGTVEAITEHGLGAKDSDKQKFKVKVKFVELLSGPQANACTTQVKAPAAFESVRFQVRLTAAGLAAKQRNPAAGLDKFPLRAANEGFLFWKHLTVEFPAATPFVFRLPKGGTTTYQLVYENDESTAGHFELEDIEVTYENDTVYTLSRDQAHPYLCARFTDKVDVPRK